MEPLVFCKIELLLWKQVLAGCVLPETKFFLRFLCVQYICGLI